MPASLDRVFSAISDYSRTMGKLHGDFLQLERRDIGRYEETTKNISDEMWWQATTMLAIASLSSALSIAGALTPAAPTGTAQNTPRIDDYAGVTDRFTEVLKTIADKFKDKAFLEAAGTGVGKLSDPARFFLESHTTELRAKQELMQLSYREGSQGKSRSDQEVSRVQEKVLSILQSKAKTN